MEDRKKDKKESNTYFEDRIAHIHNIRKSGYNAKNKIENLVSIADDYQHGGNQFFFRECGDGIYDLQLLCDSMIMMAEERMIAHEVMIMDEFSNFVELFKRNTQTQKNTKEEKSDFTDRCTAIQNQVKELISKASKIDEMSRLKNYYHNCLLRALGSVEQLDKEKRNLEWELADKSKEVEERVLMNLIEIANNKPLSTRQGLKSLLQDYMSKNNVAIGSSDFHKGLAALDDERTNLEMVVNGDIVQNKHVENEVNNVAAGGIGIKTK